MNTTEFSSSRKILSGFRGLLTKMILLIIFLSAGSLCVKASSFQNETLRYVVSYKWGIIHKDAADATMSLRKSGSSYDIVLTARTKPWADKIFMVRDTLHSKVAADGFRPVSYTKASHEGGRYERDRIEYHHSGTMVKGVVKRDVVRKNGEKSHDEKTLTASGATFDMLSVFYYLRLLDFDKMKKGTHYKMNIFSGSKTETLTIRLKGVEQLKLRDKTKQEAYRLSFTFTSGGKKKSSDDINAWVSTDSRHIPLYLTGKLPIGEVRVSLIP